MIDVRLLRTDPGLVRASLERRGAKVDLDHLIELDNRYRALLQEVEAARAEQNAAGKRIAEARGPEKSQAIAEMKRLSDRLKQLEAELAEVKSEVDHALIEVPNLVHPDAPDGFGDESNRLVRTVGSRSIAMSLPRPRRSAASSAACPPAPKVASTTVCPGSTARLSRTSCARTGT